ncbi:GNAT family N-acetyltransferase [Planococcus sp. CP5-4]|uniref:GNAT family N-acetyltransferase n=1 Tax=unclassified Planococcus (in: firmicutes) TaxID=2662419 RepID=UPI001C222184|nr:MULTISPECIES: GNAT family N-acetyltransferase [unclassified Planococcus (in: firmicutes)]MBU9673404.1 GNAT family N-acetyltransferase [Planococcus sp. CP5-4_YE]MBV0908177.1 GNAT family N-acetyltransferase [Planococcus sp. CP5-4_UN]MBW6062238.1 GNAT family N-acetyltransferase [Planococcus sp. CP5-4]
MQLTKQLFQVKGLDYCVRSAEIQDAVQLEKVRLQIDGETENMDRKRGEAYLDAAAFERLIEEDAKSSLNLFLVAEVGGQIAGFSRCEGNALNRTQHQVEFGVGVLKKFWGYGMGRKLLEASIHWADMQGIKKISLKVLESNEKAIELYANCGFRVEGVLKMDKRLADGNYYDTVVMGRII